MKPLLLLLNVAVLSMVIWVGYWFLDAIGQGSDQSAAFYGCVEVELLVLAGIVVVLTDAEWKA